MIFAPALPQRFKLGEGPHWDHETQTLTFVDIVAGEAWEFMPASGKPRCWSMPEPVSAIIPRARSGYVLAHQTGLSFLDAATGRIDKWITVDPDPANRSNETRVDPNGRLWVGSMHNNVGSRGEDLPITRSSGALHVVEGHGAATRVADGIGVSNTLCWDTARRRMYFADTMKNAIWAYDWNPETGETGGRRVHFGPHARGHADGSAIDEEGFLWNARWDGSCIIRIAPDGTVDRIIETPTRNTTSCVFGGPDLRTLYVTSARQGLAAPTEIDGALLVAEVPVKGQLCTRFKG